MQQILLTYSDVIIPWVYQPFIDFITDTNDFVFTYNACNHLHFVSLKHLLINIKFNKVILVKNTKNVKARICRV